MRIGLMTTPREDISDLVNVARQAEDIGVESIWVGEHSHLPVGTKHAFHAELTVVLDAGRLDVELAVDNTGDSAFRFTGALHSYLRVKEVENVHLQGLSGIEFRDAAKGDQVRRERGESLTIDDEVDRVYHDVAKPLLLSEGGSNLGIHAEGFPDVVVWNPWVERCAELPDMERLDFRRMLCVEAAVAKTPVMVRAGEEWFGRQTLVALG